MEENNENLNYVLKFNETVRKTVKDTNYKIKIVVIIIIGIIILGSIIFQDNLFSELSWTARIILISLALGVMFTGKTEKIKSPIEIRFYNDYLVVYREKRYYSDKVFHKEINKFFYSDISSIDYHLRTKRVNFHGKIDATFFKYNQDGSVPKEPYYHRITDGGICYFYTDLEQEVDVIKEIEEHSPLKVEIEE